MSWVGPGSHRRLVIVLLVLSVAGCAGQSPAASTSAPGSTTTPPPSAPKRIVAAVMSDPTILSTSAAVGDAFLPGMDALEQLVNAGLSVEDNKGALHAQLAEAVPSIENGLWTISEDGQMQTRWQIRDGAQWHDGTPLTAADLVFTTQVGQDRDLTSFGSPAYGSIDHVEAADARTVVVYWKKPFVDADSMFTRRMAYPLPRHLLESTYLTDKGNFTQISYWGQDFVGVGPYKLRDWVRGSHLILAANDGYVLGKPRIDDIEVKFIPDSNTLLANVLAGSVDLTMGRGLSVEQAMQARDQWHDGSVELNFNGWMVAFPQMIDPNPSAIGDVRFRRALMYGIDRQQLVDTLLFGQGGVAHSLVLPDDPEYRDVPKAVVHYDYDPRKASQLIEELGFARGPDGMYADASGHGVSVEIRTVATDISQKTTFTVADDWQRLGIGAEPLVIPAARQADLPWRATYPGFEIFNQSDDLRALPNFYSSQATTPERNYVGNNHARYMSPELDGLLDRYYVTIPKPERATVLAEILHQMSDELASVMGLFYNGQPTLVRNSVANVTPGGWVATQAWNAVEWDVRS